MAYDFIQFILIAVLVSILIYQFIPRLQIWQDNRIGLAHNRSVRTEKTPLWPSFFPEIWYRRLSDWLYRAGFGAPRAWAFYCLAGAGLFVIGFAGALLNNQEISVALLCGTAGICLLNQYIAGQIRQRREAFDKALYRIYRFLDLQISAGIKVNDALRGIPEVIDDPRVKPSLLRFMAVYELTFDLEQAVQEIRLAFSGPDCDLLSAHLKQAMQTGQVGRSLLRMEDLLFTRYFNQLQAEAQRLRQQLLWVAMLGLLPTMIVFLLPLFFSAFQAFQSILA